MNRRFIAEIKRILTFILPYGFVRWKQSQNPWIKADGDNTLRLEYQLNEDSIVFDLGGFRGDWTDRIFTKYGCIIYIFEPVEMYATEIGKRFRNNNKIKVYSLGLASKDEITQISINGVASSIFAGNSNITTLCRLKDAVTFIDNLGISIIDLMKINIEGGEYDLLEHLIITGKIYCIKNIQVQFHDFVDNAEKRMNEIQNKLMTTHELTYQYKFVWENWRIRSL